MKGNTPFKSYFGHKQDVSNFRVFGSTAWARIPSYKRKYLQPQSVKCLFIGYTEESKEFQLLNIRTKQIFIERSVRFDEPLQEVELVEENSVDFPSCSANNLGDKSGSDDSDFIELIFDINEQEISDSKSYSKVHTNLPTWAKKTLSSTGENIGNPPNLRRT